MRHSNRILCRPAHLVGAVCLSTLCAVGCSSNPRYVSPQQVGKDVIILGRVPVPIGREVTITGHHRAVGPVPIGFVVETVDGKAVAERTIVEIPGTEKWPPDITATLRGAERGTVFLLTTWMTNEGPDNESPPRQAIDTIFTGVVIEPSGLEIARDKWGGASPIAA